MQGFEHRKVGRRACGAGIGREIEQRDGDAPISGGFAPEADETGDAGGEHFGALRAGLHAAAILGELAIAGAARALCAMIGAAAYDD